MPFGISSINNISFHTFQLFLTFRLTNAAPWSSVVAIKVIHTGRSEHVKDGQKQQEPTDSTPNPIPAASPGFTKGPWKVIDRKDHPAIRTVISDKVSVEDFPFEINMPSPPFALGACGALVACKGGLPYEGTAEGTARLIAEAPNLHKALEDAEQDFLDLNEYWNGGNGSAVDACQHTCEVTEKALDKVRAVLAKVVKS
jgi:hypothetical protein